MAKIKRRGGSHKAPAKATPKKSSGTAIATDSPYSSEPKEDWEAKSALRDLHRASDITSNKNLMGRVKRHAKMESERSARIARLEGKLL